MRQVSEMECNDVSTNGSVVGTQSDEIRTHDLKNGVPKLQRKRAPIDGGSVGTRLSAWQVTALFGSN